MPDHTTTSAAQYLAEHGYTVGRGKIGGRGAPKSDTIKRWCKNGKIKARRVGYVWLIDEKTLDDLLRKQNVNKPTFTHNIAPDEDVHTEGRG